jgi:hypothetical protein
VETPRSATYLDDVGQYLWESRRNFRADVWCHYCEPSYYGIVRPVIVSRVQLDIAGGVGR